MKTIFNVVSLLALVLLLAFAITPAAQASPPTTNMHGPDGDWMCLACVLQCTNWPGLPDCWPDGICGLLSSKACGWNHPVMSVRITALRTDYVSYEQPPMPLVYQQPPSLRNAQRARYSLRE